MVWRLWDGLKMVWGWLEGGWGWFGAGLDLVSIGQRLGLTAWGIDQWGLQNEISVN